MKKSINNCLIIGLSVSVLTACSNAGTGTSDSTSRQLAVACNATWVNTTAYDASATVSYNGVNYTAAFWTQNQNPSTNSGPTGSGQPWIDNGACGATLTPTPASKPRPNVNGQNSS